MSTNADSAREDSSFVGLPSDPWGLIIAHLQLPDRALLARTSRAANGMVEHAWGTADCISPDLLAGPRVGPVPSAAVLELMEKSECLRHIECAPVAITRESVSTCTRDNVARLVLSWRKYVEEVYSMRYTVTKEDFLLRLSRLSGVDTVSFDPYVVKNPPRALLSSRTLQAISTLRLTVELTKTSASDWAEAFALFKSLERLHFRPTLLADELVPMDKLLPALPHPENLVELVIPFAILRRPSWMALCKMHNVEVLNINNCECRRAAFLICMPKLRLLNIERIALFFKYGNEVIEAITRMKQLRVLEAGECFWPVDIRGFLDLPELMYLFTSGPEWTDDDEEVLMELGRRGVVVEDDCFGVYGRECNPFRSTSSCDDDSDDPSEFDFEVNM